jgi:phosphate starvation-inducible membrane PsiE
MNSLSTRVAGTVVAFFGWLAFIVLYLAFFAGGFDFWQKLAVFIASGAIVTAIVAVIWIKWTMR